MYCSVKLLIISEKCDVMLVDTNDHVLSHLNLLLLLLSIIKLREKTTRGPS